MKPTPLSGRARPGKRIGMYAAMLLVSVLVALGLAEIALRLFPIPGITFHNFCYDDVTGAKYYPNSTAMFRGEDGVLIRRHVNSWGFPDVEHAEKAPPGTLRIGFFGDSYVEALQVPIEKTFFRLIEDDLDLRTNELARMKTRDGHVINGVETLAFGISGRGALQSYLECQRWMKRLNLDCVVYVFVENDPADQMHDLKGDVKVPYPVASGDTFVVDYSFRKQWGYKASWWHRCIQWSKANSMVVSTIEGRLKLLMEYGARRHVKEADRTGGVGGGGAPMALSAWPAELVPKGWNMQERVMDKWRAEVERAGGRFIVMHVPRGNEVLRIPYAQQDTWATRLQSYCATRHIALVEPTPLFVERMDKGQTMFLNHFTPDGHRAFADAFVRDFLADAAKQ